ncbi:MAG: anti-sigma factor [Rhodobacteraceae bacterium]|nr:anti-sigma factor [Paracoccaceae bacterium]
MSDPTGPDDDLPPAARDDLLAAEYVLGTLEGDARRAVAERAAVDGAFAARVRAWESRLGVFNDGYADAPAPDLLPQIEARLFPERPRRRGWLTGWPGGAVAAAVLVAAVFAALAFLRPPAPVPPDTVVLTAELDASAAEVAADLRHAARWDQAAGMLEVTRTAGAVPEGQDLELWLIDDSGVPVSLGLLRAAVTELAVTLAPGQLLAVSLEPEGGSPAPTPTGPVLAAAELEAM